MAYKARREYQALDFDGDMPAQYKELRKELAKLYEIKDVSLFGPVSLSSPTWLHHLKILASPNFLQSALPGQGPGWNSHMKSS